MTPARAWVMLFTFVLAYNFTSEPGQTLSEQMAEWIKRHPVLIRLGILAMALHLASAIPRRFDPIHRIFTALGRKT